MHAISSDHAPIPANPPPATDYQPGTRRRVSGYPSLPAAEYIIKQTARARWAGAPAGAASLTERQCVGLDYRAVRRRTPDRFRSYLAPPAPTRRPGALSDVTRSCSSSSSSSSSALIYRCRATRRRQRRRLTGRKSARHRRGLSATRPAGFCAATFYDGGDVLFFTFMWLMLIAKIKAATQR